MGTPIPCFASQVLLDTNTDTVSVTTEQSLSVARWYYYVSNRTTASNGQSLLYALKTILDTATSAATWTVQLSSTAASLGRLQLSHTSTASLTVTWTNTLLASHLGFATTTSTTVAASTTVTADYPSVWYWTPEIPISETGPQMFDPAVSHGAPITSPGSAHRAPDGTAVYTENGMLYDCQLTFRGVEAYYRLRTTSGYTNKDLFTWWTNGPRKGRRFLWWRDRTNAFGSNAPSEGTSSPYRYVELTPNGDMRSTFPAQPLAPPNLVWWDVFIGGWVTENGESPLSD